MGAPIDQIVDLDQVEDRAAAAVRPSGASARCPLRGRWSTPWSPETRAGASPPRRRDRRSRPSARPYIGEVSIMRPPASASIRSTARSFWRAGSPGPTSNTCQVPSPITGIASPLDGIARRDHRPRHRLGTGGHPPCSPQRRARDRLANVATTHRAPVSCFRPIAALVGRRHARLKKRSALPAISLARASGLMSQARKLLTVSGNWHSECG